MNVEIGIWASSNVLYNMAVIDTLIHHAFRTSIEFRALVSSAWPPLLHRLRILLTRRNVWTPEDTVDMHTVSLHPAVLRGEKRYSTLNRVTCYNLYGGLVGRGNHAVVRVPYCRGRECPFVVAVEIDVVGRRCKM